MVKENKLVVETRTAIGSASARRLRRDGKIPGIINNDKGEAAAIQIQGHEFEMLLRHRRGENILFDIVADASQPKKVLLKEVQHDPMTGAIRHVDFVEVSMTNKMRVRIPIVLLGEPVGVLQEGGILEHVTRELEVDCLPADLVEAIEVDVSPLKLKESVRVRDLKVGAQLTVVTPADVAVAIVSEPRKEEEEVKPEEAAVEGAEGAEEPEVIGKKKEEGEEGEEGAEEGDKKGPKDDKGARKDEKGAPARKDEKGAPAKKDEKGAPAKKDEKGAPARKEAGKAGDKKEERKK
jgi:large subunit ribosomal protein L25